MANKDEIFLKISTALNEKAGGQRPCAVCGQVKWNLVDRYAVLPVGNDPGVLNIGNQSMPLIPIVCLNCGNTHFVNLKILGFSDMSALRIDEDATRS